MVDLKKMRWLMNKLPRYLRSIDDAITEATRVTPVLTGMPSGSGVSSRVEDGAIKIAMAKEVYREALAELEYRRSELEPYINELDEPKERVCMRLRYIKGLSVYDRAFSDTAYMCERQIYRILKRAEEKIEKAAKMS